MCRGRRASPSAPTGLKSRVLSATDVVALGVMESVCVLIRDGCQRMSRARRTYATGDNFLVSYTLPEKSLVFAAVGTHGCSFQRNTCEYASRPRPRQDFSRQEYVRVGASFRTDRTSCSPQQPIPTIGCIFNHLLGSFCKIAFSSAPFPISARRPTRTDAPAGWSIQL
jgi:hypothetical protein